MSKALSIALAVKRKAKKLSAAPVQEEAAELETEPADEMLDMAEPDQAFLSDEEVAQPENRLESIMKRMRFKKLGE